MARAQVDDDRVKISKLTLLLAALLAVAPLAHAAKGDKTAPPLPDHWVGTWATANYSLDDPRRLTDLGLGASDMTLRQVVHVSLGGPLVRVELSNEFGTDSLTIGAAHLALTMPGVYTDINLPSANALTFGGKPSIVIPPGATVLSDPAALVVPGGGDLTISLFVPAQKIAHVSQHNSAYQSNYLATGNMVSAKTVAGARKVSSWYFLKGVDVRVPAQEGAVVAFGDSITDGTQNVENSNGRWPDVLARRLAAGGKKTRYLGVLNEGIGGNRVLHDGTGPSALARFDRDVLSRPGVKYLVILEAINDIGHAYDPRRPYDVVTADDLIQGFQQMVERAHQHGIKVIGATLTPYMAAGYSSPAGEQVRQALNTWIRTTKTLDGVVDFDKATADPAHPDMFLPADERGDHLHPNDAGMKVMGNAFDLKLFDPMPKEKLDIKYFTE